MVVTERAIGDIPYFAGLAQRELDQVRGLVHAKTLEKGEIVFLEGEPCRGVYFVRSGRIKIYKTSAEGREQVLRIMKRGDSFNEVPVFDRGVNPASAEAVEHSVVLYVRAEDMSGIVRAYPAVADNVLRHFAGMLRHLTGLVEDLSFRHVTSRLAKALLHQVATPSAGTLREGGQPRVTQQELAAMVGTAREVVGRSLRAMESRGALRIEGHRIVIVDRAKLEEMI